MIGCEFYGDVFKAPRHYQIDNIWDIMAREPGFKKVASNLKSLPLRFLHHFIAFPVQCKTYAFTKLTTDGIWLLEMASTGTKINLTRFIMKKMLKIMNEKEKEARSKRKKTSLCQFAIPYVTLITHYAKSSKLLQPKYELILIAVTYNLASIAKMGYKDTNNNGIFVKVRGAQEEDDEGEEGEPAQDQAILSLGQVMDVLGEIQLSIGQIHTKLDSMHERLDSLGTQVAGIDKKMSLGVSMEGSYMVIQLSRDLLKPPNHLLMQIISYAFHF